MNRAEKIIYAICGIVILLHIWGAIDTSHYNWGFHFFGFYDQLTSLIALSLILILFIPKVQTVVIKSLEQFVRWLKKFPYPLIYVLISGALFGLIYLFPAKLHLLGDGAVLLRSVPQGIMGNEITLSFRNQPLMFWIYRTTIGFHSVDGTIDPHEIYFTIDLIAALLILGILFWGMRLIQRPPIERIFIGALIFFAGGCQFFFGYIENYVLQYVVIVAYLITGWYSLEKRVHLAVPIFLFILMVLLHLGNIVFIPSLFLFIILKWKKSKLYAAAFLMAVSIAGFVILYFAGFNIIDMTRHLKSGTVDILQPFTAIGGNFPYPMFSFRHLIDWFNSSMLTAPFGLFLSIALIPVMPKERRFKNPIFLFLLLSACCGIFFTWVINSALGLVRDWDLFASFFVPIMILPIYILSQPIELPRWKNSVFVIVIITIFHTASWIGLNASPEKHLMRLQKLNNPTFLSLAAQMAQDEALANFFFDNQRYSDARIYYEHFLTIDSTNPRIIGNISDVYRRIGERDKYFRMLKRAVDLKSPDPGVYSNLGVEYANHGDTLNAIKYNEIAIQMNPATPKAHANLGVLYASIKNYALADQHFTTAISLGMREPIVFRYAGDIAVRRGDLQRAIGYYDTFLSFNPNDVRVKTVRDQIYQHLQKKK